MALLPYGLSRAVLFNMDPEAAHDLTIDLLARGAGTPLQWTWCHSRIDDPVTLAGLALPNRVGLAAGLDKNARAIDGLAAMGFGFVEVGTVTPLAQPGNPRPRMFRLPAAQALINRMGFNNDGLDAFVRNVQNSRFHSGLRTTGGRQRMILGLNIGKNAATPIERATDDYLVCLAGVYPHADYVTVNISSPNTKNLRALQSDEALDALLSRLQERKLQLQAQHGRVVPMFLKIAPDLDEGDIDACARVLGDLQVDGVIATNTTIARDGVAGADSWLQRKGAQRRALMGQATTVLRMLRTRLPDAIPLIGVGGILHGADAATKQTAGASLVQTYTGLVYRGPALIGECVEALRRRKEAPSRGTLPPDHP